MLEPLSHDQRQPILVDLFAARELSLDDIGQFFRDVRVKMDPPAATSLAGQIDRHVAASAAGYNYHIAAMLPEIALCVPPAMIDAFASRWSDDRWSPMGKSRDEFFRTLQLRADLQKEFQS